MLLILTTNLRLSNEDGTFDDRNSRFTTAFLNNLTYLAPGNKLGYHLTPGLTT